MAGRDFEQLEVYQIARDLRKRIYRLAESLLNTEKFNLAQQMRRAALSVSANIAEGHGTYTFRQNISYLHRARGSVYELRDDLNLCDDEEYAGKELLEDIKGKAVRLITVINGYIRYLRRKDSAYDQPGGVEARNTDVPTTERPS